MHCDCTAARLPCVFTLLKIQALIHVHVHELYSAEYPCAPCQGQRHVYMYITKMTRTRANFTSLVCTTAFLGALPIYCLSILEERPGALPIYCLPLKSWKNDFTLPVYCLPQKSRKNDFTLPVYCLPLKSRKNDFTLPVYCLPKRFYSSSILPT